MPCMESQICRLANDELNPASGPAFGGTHMSILGENPDSLKSNVENVSDEPAVGNFKWFSEKLNDARVSSGNTVVSSNISRSVS